MVCGTITFPILKQIPYEKETINLSPYKEILLPVTDIAGSRKFWIRVSEIKV
jgi:hypothetical protein